jgi:hypothetical protein
MKKSLKLFLTVTAATIVIVVSSEPMFARGGGAANIMNSPGYQRLQASRQQVSQPDAQPSATHRRKWRHASTDVLLALAGWPCWDGLSRCFY